MKNETIVDRVVERIKLQPLGDLITEEDLHDIVKEAIPKAFFEKRRERDTSLSYSDNWVEKEPIIVEVLRDAMKASAEKVVREYLVQHENKIAEYWTQVLEAGLMKHVAAIQDRLMGDNVRMVLNAAYKPVNERRQMDGLPPIYF